MRFAKRISNAGLVTLVALIVAAGVAACGSSAAATSKKVAAATTTSKGSGTTGTAARSAFAACLKQHGVTLPAGGAGGFQGRTTPNGTPPTGAPPNGGGGQGGGGQGGGGQGGGFPGGGGNSKFAKAFQACRSKLPSGFGGGGGFPGQGGRPGGAGATGGTTQFSKSALTSFVACIRKNGYAAMPEANTSGTGAVFPASVEKNAEFKSALPKCESILRSSFRRPSATGQQGGSST